ncbi:MAG: hypothetical protein QG661_2978 [Actinomycetota bacterium]|nr:hypothetical protein [Actinomycetota bacterium]
MGDRVNLVYASPSIAEFYREHRTAWEEFYPSERQILDGLGIRPDSSLIDLGCGCGGLGVALNSRFGLTSYVGVEINGQAAREAQTMVSRFGGVVIEGDVATLDHFQIPHGPTFDYVVSLSCIDWNVQFDDMLAQAWQLVSPGGWLVVTLRVHPVEQATTIEDSYQFIRFDGERSGEKAPYIYINAKCLNSILTALSPSEVRAVGYWGPPSPTAVTSATRLCFMALAARKVTVADDDRAVLSLELPRELIAALMS